MNQTKPNLLHDAIFSIHDADGPGTADLAEILARLGAGDELEFPALRPHQSHPWHAFLVQLGALVAARTHDDDLARTPPAPGAGPSSTSRGTMARTPGLWWWKTRSDRRSAQARVERVGDVQKRILRPALCALLQGAPEDLNLRDDRPQRWLDRLDGTVDDVFFDDLWRDFDLDAEDADANWEGRLYDLARTQLDDAKRSAPVPEARGYRAVATAEMIFEGAARKHLKHRFPPDLTEEGRADDRTATS
ncbi:MAG: hypothetical protein V3T72_08835 [Thermoanaerobaculia bacterium]